MTPSKTAQEALGGDLPTHPSLDPSSAVETSTQSDTGGSRGIGGTLLYMVSYQPDHEPGVLEYLFSSEEKAEEGTGKLKAVYPQYAKDIDGWIVEEMELDSDIVG